MTNSHFLLTPLYLAAAVRVLARAHSSDMLDWIEEDLEARLRVKRPLSGPRGTISAEDDVAMTTFLAKAHGWFHRHEIALMTRAEFLEAKDPQHKRHDSELWDHDVKKLNPTYHSVRTERLDMMELDGDLDPQKAELIRKLAKAVDSSKELQDLVEKQPLLKATAAYVRSLHSSPYGSKMWRVAVALHAMDTLPGTHGVEALGPVRTSGSPYEYLNTGDPYTTTLIYKKATDNLFIGTWGDIAEKHPNW